MTPLAWYAEGERRGRASRAGNSWVILAALMSVLLAGCAKTPAPEQVAYFQGATKANNLSRDIPYRFGDAGGALSEVGVTPPGPVPKFDVVAERTNDRPDNVVSYYVVINPVEPKTDAFKLAVKQVLGALAVNNGGPVFSATIWDHLPAAQTDVTYRINPNLFSDELFKARETLNDQHLIANYVGGLSAGSEPPSYVLFWYPESGVQSPDVGRWVSAEVWEASPMFRVPAVTVPDVALPAPVPEAPSVAGPQDVPAAAPPAPAPEGVSPAPVQEQAPPAAEDAPALVLTADDK